MKKFSIITLLCLLFFIVSGCEDLTPNNDDNPIDSNIEKINIESFDRLFNDEMMKTLTIKITENEWMSLNDAMKSYAKQFDGDLRTDYYAKANLTYEDDLGEVEILDIGLRTRGNLSRVLIDRKSVV